MGKKVREKRGRKERRKEGRKGKQRKEKKKKSEVKKISIDTLYGLENHLDCLYMERRSIS